MKKKTKIKITIAFLDIENDAANIEEEGTNSTFALINRSDAESIDGCEL